MKIELMQQAVIEARRFIDAVEKAESAMYTNNVSNIQHLPKESGRVKRASLDLTRALADMRNMK